jgi:hypothetical protein
MPTFNRLLMESLLLGRSGLLTSVMIRGKHWWLVSYIKGVVSNRATYAD